MTRLRIRQPAKPAPPEPATDDATLFRSAVGRVRALDGPADVLPAPARPAPQARQFERDESRVMEELLDHAFDPGAIEVGEEILHLKPGISRRLLKRLRRGHYSIRAELDLHEMTAAVARPAIMAFLDEAIAHGEGCVRIIHGKGLRSSARGPVLKKLTEQLLRRRGDVLAFASALPAQGGTGAVLVLLRHT